MLVRSSLRSRARAYAVPPRRRSQKERITLSVLQYEDSVGKLPVMAVAGYTVLTKARHAMFAPDTLASGGRAI